MRNRVVNQHVLKAISIGLAAFIATSTPLTALAADGDSDGGDDSHSSEQSESKSQSDHKESASKASDSAKSSSESAKSSSESAKSSSESASSSAESAKSSSESAKSSADSAKGSSDTASDKAESAKSSVDGSADVKNTTSDKTKDSLSDASDKADDSKETKEAADAKSSEAKDTVTDAIEAAAKATDDSTDDSDATTDSLQGKINEFNIDAQNKLVDVKAAELDGVTDEHVTDEQFKSVADISQKAKEDVLTALETALQTDGQERVDAAKAADEAAKLAQEAAKEAQDNLDAAKADYEAKLAAYNAAAALLGLPAYDPSAPISELPTENPDLSEKLTEIDNEYKAIDESLKDAQEAAIADLEQAKADYEAAEATAKEAADTAELAANAAEKAQDYIKDVQDGALADSKDAVEDAKKAAGEAEDAIKDAEQAAEDAAAAKDAAKAAAEQAAKDAEDAKKSAAEADDEAEKTLNYYIDQVNKELTDEVDGLYAQRNACEESCVNTDRQVEEAEQARKDYVDTYIKNYAGKEPSLDDYKKWDKWKYPGDKISWELKVEEAKWKVKSEKEYKDLSRTLADCQNARDDAYEALAAKKAEVAAKEHELEERKAAVNAIQNDYLNKLENGQKEAVEAALAALKDQYTLADRDSYLAAEKVIMGMTDAVFHQYQQNPEWMDTLYDKIKYKEEVATAKGIANQYSSEDEAFRDAQKKMAAYLEEEFEGKVVGYGDWEGFLDPMTVGERTAVIKAMANACSQYYLEAYNDYQAKVSALDAADYAKDAADYAKDAEKCVAGLDGLDESLAASKANVDAAQGILDTIKDTDGKLKAENVYDQTADYISGVKNQVGAVAYKANKIKENANNLAVASEKGAEAAAKAIKSYQDQIDAQKKVTKEVYDALRAEGSDYDKLKKELATLLAKLNTAEATLEKAKSAVTEAKAVAVAVKTLAQYTNNYASYEDEYASYKEQGEGSIPLATGFAQISRDEEGNIIYNTANDKGYDQSNGGVFSRPVSDFADISGWKGLEVPETIYQDYLTQIAARHRDAASGIEDKAGRGISIDDTMPVIYWELGEDGKATGRFFGSTDELTDGAKYFVAYTFKKESDMDKKGYHLDGFRFLFSYEAPEKEEEIDDGTTDDGTNGSNNGGGSSSGRRTSTGMTVTIGEEAVPLAAGLDGVIIDEEDVPLAAGLDEVVIEDEAVALSDSIPQTGDNAVSVAPVAATGITALLSAFFLGKRKKED